MYKGYENLSGKYWYDIKYNAKKRGISFSDKLTIKYAWDLFIKQNKKCALSGLDIELYPDIKTRNTASLDRINNSKGYSKCNIQWLHKSVNTLKYKMTNEETIELCRKIFFNDLSARRPDWPEYFINMAKLVSTRSRDPSTKCGCIFTDNQYRIISTGYNGNFQGVDDNLFSWERPAKYLTVVHSEMNGLIFAKQSLEGCYAFITGIPCSNCCKHMLQAGICKIYYGNNTPKMCDEKDLLIVRNLCKIKNVELIKIDI
jgi:dCMP deaminase